MGQKKQSQLGFFLITTGLLVLLVSSLAYYKFSSTVSMSPYTTIQLDLSNKEITKTTDLIYLKEKEKNGTKYEIQHILKNTGNHDISHITLEGFLLQKNNQNEAQYIYIQSIQFGDQLYTPKYMKYLGFDQNRDDKISLYEFTMNEFPLGSLIKNQERKFVIKGVYEKGLPPFNSDNKESRILMDLTYNVD